MIALRSIHRFLHLTLTVIFSCGRLQIAYNQRAYTKCYPNIFLSVYIHVNTKTAFSFFQYPHTRGSADLYQLIAGLAVACRYGFEIDDALGIAEKT